MEFSSASMRQPDPRYLNSLVASWIWRSREGEKRFESPEIKLMEKWDPPERKFEQTISYEDAASTIGFVLKNQKKFFFISSSSEVVWTSYGVLKQREEKNFYGHKDL